MRDNSQRRRHGSALIEVLIALVLLAVSGTALIALLGQTAHSMRSTLDSERLAHGAAQELDRLAIASRAELVALTGRRSLNGWWIEIALDSPSLVGVAVAESDTTAAILRTTFYRPPSDSVDAIR